MGLVIHLILIMHLATFFAQEVAIDVSHVLVILISVTVRNFNVEDQYSTN